MFLNTTYSNITYVRKQFGDTKRIMYLQRGYPVIVKSGHLFLCESIASLVIDLKASVELQHVQQLHESKKHYSTEELSPLRLSHKKH